MAAGPGWGCQGWVWPRSARGRLLNREGAPPPAAGVGPRVPPGPWGWVKEAVRHQAGWEGVGSPPRPLPCAVNVTRKRWAGVRTGRCAAEMGGLMFYPGNAPGVCEAARGIGC